MRNFIYTIILLLFVPVAFVACDDWTEVETVNVQHPNEKTGEYLTDLKAYKSVMFDRQVAFGWFGGWTASGPSLRTRLSSVPDSVDIVALWGNMWHRDKMTPEKIEDLKYVRETKGTRVLVTTLLAWVGKEFPDIPEEDWPEGQEGLIAYAEALAKEVIDLGFDGLDIDYEPTIGGYEDVRDCPRGEDMVVFVKELGKYLGPKSGTGKLLVIDGQNSLLPAEVADYFNYAIGQNYTRSSNSSLQSDYNGIRTIFRPEQYIITENFESYWRDGGVGFSHPDLGTIRSLKGMALWSPTQGRKGGCGTYHMEYEYMHSDNDYKYLREAIQIMNPSVR
ncbi:hypothetical protein M2451_004121 [Dysgonomonas sp. PFB1-18]|uniref:glycoside hydrolase family 18 n=1 Tax=unclassified Dysgonomonas TaxID=2630389 RepID=UPI0024765860|nr:MULTISPECIES: glycoside hydrolase family 18 [unclassified Dysgonomonas]MDH6311190.1 hypothetical protein [Dysgonomonas sp. PF1-14]MDH6341076.1 hypothetical protein [Dysgonomonas sp. PF1-16]MDH6382771.1 hypothetical protein [Dysgonomonas sp. PFB1-18]MDH6400062.1 hypothetical protein [Dysgonomonas sp. PF1-23]